jgi:hypothetical protein
MNKLHINALTLAVSLIFSTGAMAQAMSKDDYKAGKEQISVEYNKQKTACAAFSSNKKDICVADAKGKERIAKAQLELNYKPTIKNQYNLRIATADATYAVARERCDDLAGNAKDVCVKQAKSERVAAKADAKVQMKSLEANSKANEKSAEARSDANVKVADVKKDAAESKLDAQYSVEKEKCDKFAGATKDSCLLEVKTRFGKK